jgi:hypothetical protein
MGNLAVAVRDATYHGLSLSGVSVLVIEKLRELGSHGATRHELASMLNRPISSMCGRINELEKANLVVETGETRATQFGKEATVVALVGMKHTPQSGVTYRISKPDSPSRTVEVFYDTECVLMAQDIAKAPHEFGYLTPVADLWAYRFEEVEK